MTTTSRFTQRKGGWVNGWVLISFYKKRALSDKSYWGYDANSVRKDRHDTRVTTPEIKTKHSIFWSGFAVLRPFHDAEDEVEGES